MRKRERSEESAPSPTEVAKLPEKEDVEEMASDESGAPHHIHPPDPLDMHTLEPKPSTQKPIHPFFLKSANRPSQQSGAGVVSGTAAGASPKSATTANTRLSSGPVTKIGGASSVGNRGSTTSKGGTSGTGLVQMCLDAGQKEIGAVTCSLCGMVYMKQVDDVREHARLCASLQAEKAAADRVRTPLTAAPPHLYSSMLSKKGNNKSGATSNHAAEPCERVHSTLIPTGFCCHKIDFAPTTAASGPEESLWLTALLEELGMLRSSQMYQSPLRLHGSSSIGPSHESASITEQSHVGSGSRCTGFLWFREGVPAVEAVLLYRENRRTVDDMTSDWTEGTRSERRGQTLVDITSVWVNTSNSTKEGEQEAKKKGGAGGALTERTNHQPGGKVVRKPTQPAIDDLDLFEAVLRPSALANFFSKPAAPSPSTATATEAPENPHVLLLKSVFDVFLQKAVYGYSLRPHEICLPSTLLPRYSTTPGDPIPAVVEEALSLFTMQRNETSPDGSCKQPMRLPCPLYD